jgi:hypothetical protein
MKKLEEKIKRYFFIINSFALLHDKSGRMDDLRDKTFISNTWTELFELELKIKKELRQLKIKKTDNKFLYLSLLGNSLTGIIYFYLRYNDLIRINL